MTPSAAKAAKVKEQVADLLLEIGAEEIPAGMIPGACQQLKAILEKHLATETLLLDAEVTTFGAPRRLVAACAKIRLKQADVVREVTGPPKSVAFGADGKPTRAAESFAGKQGVAVGDLYLTSTPRGEYVAARQTILGKPAAERLQEILPSAIGEIPWPRSMYWTGTEGLRFIRPIRWIVALLGGKPVRFALDGVTAGNTTAGHRFLGKPRVTVQNLATYLSRLRENYVLAWPEERREKIDGELAKLASRKSLQVNDDPGLTTLVTYLNEYPTAIMGDFDPSYLDLPEEILITVMRGHQKYFALRGGDGNLAAHFLAVINLAGDAKGIVRGGHERVLRARFADARFFWQADQKCRLADYLPKLSQVTFQVKLGSYGDKVERVRSLARWIAEKLSAGGQHPVRVADADRAAELAKCDLVTDMVREFTELQGIVGGLYAKAQGEPSEIYWAVYDQYRPAGLDDDIPRNLTGATLALADKLDTLVGCFAVGIVPTGSSDPFALRRAAIGIVKVILELKISLSLSEAIAAAARGLAAHKPNIKVSPETEKQILDFLLDRARFVFTERQGYAYDEINAAFGASADDLVDAGTRIAAVRAIRKSTDFEPLAVSFKRIRKIIEKAGDRQAWQLPAVRPELFEAGAERALHAAAQRVAAEVEKHKSGGRYQEALAAVAQLRPEVDAFFEQVMVMAHKEDVRRNRLTLLSGLLSEFSTIADFSELAPSEK